MAALRPTPADPEPDDGRVARGQRTRTAIIDEAVQVASTDGLDGLSIARLADATGMAKSSVHAAFGSKESLQLATIARTREVLIDLVIRPGLAHPPGLDQLAAVGDAWFAYLEDDIFRGGCVLCAASTELDAHPGETRDALTAVMREWLDFLAGSVRAGIEDGTIRPEVDARRAALELHAIGFTANWHHQLFGTSGEPDSEPTFALARDSWAAALDRLRAD